MISVEYDNGGDEDGNKKVCHYFENYLYETK